MKIENRTFVVSGGSSGLGLATVTDLVKSSSTYVAILDRNEPSTSLPNTKYFNIDLTEVDKAPETVEAVMAWTKQTGAPLGGIINCAGVAVASRIINANNEPHPLDLWDLVISINLTGSFNLTRLFLQHLAEVPPENGKDGERGIVIFTSSAAAFEGTPGQTAYSATKGAIASMTLPMARDLGRHGIRVMSIAPGAFDSAMTEPMSDKVRKALIREGAVFPHRFGQPEEFARACRFIIETPYMNGEVLRLSAGGRLPARL